MFKKKKAGFVLLAAAIIAAAAFGAGLYIRATYTVKEVYVEGNVHYTRDEIKAIVMDGIFGENSLYLSLKYKNRGIRDVPFVDAMDVQILAPDTIKIVVYEKMLIGYVRYLDTYMYFDRDGCVVESSGVKTAGIPQIIGLEFDHVVLGQALPVENQGVFENILNVTMLLKKYGLSSDKLYFNKLGDVVIYFGSVKAALGRDAATFEDKIMILPELIPGLEGKSGTLQMSSYDENGGKYTFRQE